MSHSTSWMRRDGLTWREESAEATIVDPPQPIKNIGRPGSGSGLQHSNIIPTKNWGRPSARSFGKGCLAITTAALQNGCHQSLQIRLELAVPGHSMHLWTHWNVVEAILVKNMLKWGWWCEVVMLRNGIGIQLKTYSESQIHTETMHTTWVSKNTRRKQEKKEKREALRSPWNLILAVSDSNINCTKMRGRIQLKPALNDTPQFLL